MKNLFIALMVLSSVLFAGTADQVYVMPHTGNTPGFGQIDLSKSAAIKNVLPVANGGSGVASAPSFPTTASLLSTGTTAGYLFSVSSANATVGATYTNNANTYTVLSTISSGTLLWCSQAAAPTSTGTLTKASGTGDSTITFTFESPIAVWTVPAGATWIHLKMVGGGGGGGSNAAEGTNGTYTAFGFSYVAGFGAGTSAGFPAAEAGSIGGDISVAGGYGTIGGFGSPVYGGSGGNSCLGGGGFGGTSGATNAFSGQANTGGGGGGGGGTSARSGGSSGGCVEKTLTSLASSYWYAVGIGGTGGSTSGGNSAGGAGGTGAIYLDIHYGS